MQSWNMLSYSIIFEHVQESGFAGIVQSQKYQLARLFG